MEQTRRHFLTLSGLGGALALLPKEAWALQLLEPIKVDNPLAGYPSRDWETVYRDIWRYDSKFVFLCAPNDTHNCLLAVWDGGAGEIGARKALSVWIPVRLAPAAR